MGGVIEQAVFSFGSDLSSYTLAFLSALHLLLIGNDIGWTMIHWKNAGRMKGTIIEWGKSDSFTGVKSRETYYR